MDEEKVVNQFLNQKTKSTEFDQLNIFNEITLNNIFNEEEVQIILKEPIFYESCNEEANSGSSSNRMEKAKYKNIPSFNRMGLILKLLKLSISQLYKHKENTTAKGIEWVIGEIQDSLIFKSDEKTLKNLEKLKEENQDIQVVLKWVEEYSTLNVNQDISNTLKKNHSTMKALAIPVKNNAYFSNYFTSEGIDLIDYNTNTDLDNIMSYNTKMNYMSNSNLFLNVPETLSGSIESPNFDVFELEKSVGKENTLSTVSCYIFLTLGLYSVVNYAHFENFLEVIRNGYKRENSYHNDLHATDVQQTCYTFFKLGGLKEVLHLSDLDCAAFLISAIIHDYKHPGVTNTFLVNSKNKIATRYNDQSVLENFHVSETFKIIKTYKDANIFSELTNEEYKVMRKRIIDCVLATDMTLHNKEYSYLKMKQETFNIRDGKNIDKIFENLDNIGVFTTQQDILNTLLHTADISNPTKPIKIYSKWVDLVMEEFWQQGDKEKKLSLPISFLCDRITTKVPSSQLGFMDGIVFPLIQIVVNFFPGLTFMKDNIETNKIHYKKLKDEEEKLNDKVK